MSTPPAKIATVKSAIDQANKQYNEIKNNPALSDEDKASAKKLISDQKNAKLKEIMGAENYSKYNAVRKKQKAASPGQ